MTEASHDVDRETGICAACGHHDPAQLAAKCFSETREHRIARQGTDGWIGVDLDGTFAHYDGWHGETHIGPPIPAMLERVRGWLSVGQQVRIFTARVSGHWTGDEESAQAAEEAIRLYCLTYLGQELQVTAVKDYQMIELWDDRAIQVVPNTGRTLAEEHAAELSALRGAP